MPDQGRPEKIAFIGAGNMAGAIIGGLLDTGFSPNSISAADLSERALGSLKAMRISDVSTQAADVVANASLVVLAVKPQGLRGVAQSIKGHLSREATVMSIAAGVSCDSLSEMLGDPNQPIVRCMPNTPALVRCGASALYGAPGLSEKQRQQADAVMASVGTTLWVDDEAQLDAVTAVSGSGPAYFFAFMEAMIEKGVQLGLTHEDANRLTLQTALGAARLASEQKIPIDVLRSNVTSPGGTTAKALAAFSDDHLSEIVARAMQACFERAKEMAEEFK